MVVELLELPEDVRAVELRRLLRLPERHQKHAEHELARAEQAGQQDDLAHEHQAERVSRQRRPRLLEGGGMMMVDYFDHAHEDKCDAALLQLLDPVARPHGQEAQRAHAHVDDHGRDLDLLGDGRRLDQVRQPGRGGILHTVPDRQDHREHALRDERDPVAIALALARDRLVNHLRTECHVETGMFRQGRRPAKFPGALCPRTFSFCLSCPKRPRVAVSRPKLAGAECIHTYT